MPPFARAAAAEVVGAETRARRRAHHGRRGLLGVPRRACPACFIAIGSRNESRGLHYDHHHPRFDVDEAALRIGAEVLLRTAKRFLAS